MLDLKLMSSLFYKKNPVTPRHPLISSSLQFYSNLLLHIHNRNTINLQSNRDRHVNLNCMYKLWECVFLSQTTGRVNKSNSMVKKPQSWVDCTQQHF